MSEIIERILLHFDEEEDEIFWNFSTLHYTWNEIYFYLKEIQDSNDLELVRVT